MIRIFHHSHLTTRMVVWRRGGTRKKSIYGGNHTESSYCSLLLVRWTVGSISISSIDTWAWVDMCEGRDIAMWEEENKGVTYGQEAYRGVFVWRRTKPRAMTSLQETSFWSCEIFELLIGHKCERERPSFNGLEIRIASSFWSLDYYDGMCKFEERKSFFRWKFFFFLAER